MIRFIIRLCRAALLPMQQSHEVIKSYGFILPYGLILPSEFIHPPADFTPLIMTLQK